MMNKTIKIVLPCAVILLFIGGSIAAAEQTNITAQNEPTHPGLLPGQFVTPDGRVYCPSTYWFYLKNSDTGGAADISVQDGTTGDIPITGDWDGK